ncbi:MAG: IS66 family transposase [Bacteroidales bacterium]
MQNGQGIPSEKGVFLTHEAYDALMLERKENNIEIAYLKQELAQLKRMIFGSKSERFIAADPDQLSLGLDIEQKEETEKQETEIIPSYERQKSGKKKKVPVRMPLPSHLPRVRFDIEPEEDVTGAKNIGVEITEILEYEPGKFFVKQYNRSKYLLPENKGIVIGDLPSFPIPRGNAGPGLLAYLSVSKFMDHLPFYRLVQIFKREGITIAESTINGWFAAIFRLMEPLYDKMQEMVRHSSYLMADETPIPVLTRDKPGSTHKGYHWLYLDPQKKLVCFDYRKGRGREGPEEFLEGFQGALQTDGYAAYNKFEKQKTITMLACMAHARRKFDQSKDNDPQRAAYALSKFQQLYDVERKARNQDLSYEDRRILRQEESVPVLTELEQWLRKELTEVLPSSSIGQAITYTLKFWKRLVRYTEDGSWEIDNNWIENCVRPVALGRKNYMFAGSHEGAKRAAMMYSFMGTCKLQNVDPYAWLKDVLTKIPDHSIQNLEELLPGYQPEETK